MRILIANAQTPFVRGGAEMLADGLLAAIQAHGHQAEIVTMPFKWYPASRIHDAMMVARLMEVSEWCGGPIDRLIALKFPAYLMPHPNKVMWLLHQYRGAYDLWDAPEGDLRHAPDGAHVRHSIHAADRQIGECRAVYTISRNVSRRLLQYNGIQSEPIYHPPPNAEQIRTGTNGDYFLFPGRINETKRQHLVIEALAFTTAAVRVVFIGTADASAYMSMLRERVDILGLGDRVVWSGIVDNADKLTLYADCRAVLAPPLDEDYGYVALEAMLAGKPVVTCSDSGGPLDFVVDGQTGLVCAPEPTELAAAIMELWSEPARAERLGAAGLATYRALDLRWDWVVESLLS